MKKALSLLLALTLIFAMAAPASAAYTGRFSRDDTYNGVAYLISASCTLYTAKASVSYADPSSSVSLRLKVYLQDGDQLIYTPSDTDGNCSVSKSYSTVVEQINAQFTILGTQIAGVYVEPA